MHLKQNNPLMFLMLEKKSVFGPSHFKSLRVGARNSEDVEEHIRVER